jgi:antitoxin HicB
MPKSLHRRLAETAEREGVSLNQYIVYLVSTAR